MPPARRNAVIVLASVALLAATAWAWSSTEIELDDLRWTPIVLAFLVGGPASIAMKAAGFVVSARMVGQRPAPARTLEVAVVSSAANLLPVPGSLLVTIRSLSEDGSTYGNAIAAGTVPGLAWLGFAGIFGGVAIGVEGAPWLSVVVVGLGLAASIGAVVLFRRVVPVEGRGRLFIGLVAAQAGWLAVSALRLGLAMSAVGLDYGIGQAISLSVAGATSTAVGFVPGGLGVREALIAALSPLIGLPLDAGVLVGTIDRLIWLAFLAVATFVLMLGGRTRSAATPDAFS